MKVFISVNEHMNDLQGQGMLREYHTPKFHASVCSGQHLGREWAVSPSYSEGMKICPSITNDKGISDC